MSFHRIEADPQRFEKIHHRPWELYHPPFRIAPHVYSAGANAYVGAYLLDTGAGLALIDTTMQELIFLLYEGFAQLGFQIRDLKYIFLTHIHGDHSGCAQTLKMRTGAKIYLSKEEEDFLHRRPELALNPDFQWFPFQADAYYSDSAPIQAGRFTIHTKLTPGHTPGTTSFYFDDTDERGQTYHCAIHGGMGVGSFSSTALKRDGFGPEVRERFLSDLAELSRWPVDICIPSHPNQADLLSCVPEDKTDFRPFVDAKRWSAMLADCQRRVLEIAER